MVLVFRSLKIGLLAMIPNATPILVTFGVMGFTGVRLNTATAMIASVSIGIAVDDTIHYLSRYLEELNIRRNPIVAMRRSILTIGPPLCFTTFVITAGFMALAFSDYMPFLYFGVLTSLTMVSALLADLLFLPALLVIFKPMPRRMKTQKAA